MNSLLSKHLRGIHHVGITVEDMSKALEFYVDILGGKLIAEIQGIDGEQMHNTLLQIEELEAIENKKDVSNYFVPDLRNGTHKLDIYLVSFENLVIELLQYRDAKMPSKASQCFPAKHSNSSPAFVNSMHISFYLNEEVDVDLFARELEEECKKRGMHQVRCNRAVRVYSEAERQNVDKSFYSYKIMGAFEGWTMFYCKGPNGEQLEFNQLKGKSKQFFKGIYE